MMPQKGFKIRFLLKAAWSCCKRECDHPEFPTVMCVEVDMKELVRVIVSSAHSTVTIMMCLEYCFTHFRNQRKAWKPQ